MAKKIGEKGVTEGLPLLRYDATEMRPAEEVTEWLRALGGYTAVEFGLLGAIFDLNNARYPEGPALPDAEEPDNWRDKEIAKSQLSTALKWSADMELARSRIYAIMRGQLSTSSVAALSARPQFEMLERSRNDPLQLKNLIVVVHLTPNGASVDRCRTFARERFQAIEIGADSLDDFKTRFAAAAMVLALVGEEMSAARQAEEFFHKLERSRFAEAIRQAHNAERQFASVQDVVLYVSAYKYAPGYVSVSVAQSNEAQLAIEAATVSGEAIAAVAKADVGGSKGKCHFCGIPGHLEKNCWKKKRALERNQTRDAHTRTMEEKLGECQRQLQELKLELKKERTVEEAATVGLDTMASEHIFSSGEAVTNVRKTDRKVVLHGIDAGSSGIFIDEIADTKFGEVYYSQKVAGNILSFAKLRNEDKGTKYDMAGDVFVVLDVDNKEVRFRQDQGLYVADICCVSGKINAYAAPCNGLTHDLDNIPAHKCFSTDSRHNSMERSALPLPSGGKPSPFTKQEIARAEQARDLQRRLGFPSFDVLKKVLRRGDVENCNLAARDAERAEQLFGPSEAAIKGKATGHKPTEVGYVPIRNEEVYQEMHSDIHFLCGQAFLISVVKPMHFILTTAIRAKTSWELRRALQEQIASLRGHNVVIRVIKSDPESGIVAIVDDMKRSGILPNVTGAKEAVPAVERANRTLKDIARAVIHGLPFALPTSLVPALMKYVTHRANIVPSSTGWRDDETPWTRMTGRKVSSTADVSLGFGDYVLIMNAKVDNTMTPRATGCIALYPVGNVEGTWAFLNLASQKELRRQRWRKTVITQEVVAAVNAMRGTARLELATEDHEHEAEKHDTAGREAGKPAGAAATRTASGLTLSAGAFSETRAARSANEHEETLENSRTSAVVESSQPNRNPGAGENAEENPGVRVEAIEKRIEELSRKEAILQEQIHALDKRAAAYQVSDDHDVLGEGQAVQVGVVEGAPAEWDLADCTMTTKNVLDGHGEQAGPASVGGLSTKRTAADQGGSDGCNTYAGEAKRRRIRLALITEFVQAHCLKAPTVSWLRAVQEYGEPALESVMSELVQLGSNGHDVFEPVTRRLSEDELRNVLPVHLFVTEKRDPQTGELVRLKARLVAGGDRQDPELYPNTSSPTVATESLFALAAMSATQGRKVASVDFPGAYLNAVMPSGDPPVFVRFAKALAKCMTTADPTLQSHLSASGTLVCRLKKALYGCRTSAKLWYDHLCRSLAALGYQRSMVDYCVFRSDEDDTWLALHVDDMKIMAVNDAAIVKLVKGLEPEYGVLTMRSGSVIEYLQMVFDYNQPGQVTVRMPAYADKIIEQAEPFVLGKVGGKTPALDDLFQVQDSPLLAASSARAFHTTACQLLYLSKRARPDLLVAASFLTGRVQAPTEQDREKLRRVVQYLQGTRELGLTLGCVGAPRVHCFIDASFGVHSDMKSHSGCMVSLGRGTVYGKSSRQSLASKSSTEAELVAISDCIGQALWIERLLRGLGVECLSTLLYQDNEATMKLVRNGRPNSSRTRHIALRHFFVSDRVACGEIEMTYCPTEQMVADAHTKPLQGKAFRSLRERMLGVEVANLAQANTDRRECVDVRANG
ncbi:Copia protein [Porphyridium purpureum]|uniref:Copia protein n=1 Tax=Porphyridium purpureum TaxID=35688 RepID=A0A5J4Z2E8_PORPP|nr:Copia protein [Porphyridium purpureum]KAA8498448.1 Copia protein [Porphyridium purpureum]|eukprot:POR9152..scf208_2